MTAAVGAPDPAAVRLPSTMRFLQRDWLSSNNVLFVDPDTTALVDSGYVRQRDMTLALVRRLLGGRPLERLVNTHLHSDHCGGNALLQASYRCVTAVPAVSVDAVRRWDLERLSFETTLQRCDRFGCDEGLADGATIELGRLRWRVIAAPGHDPDAVMLHCADEGVLISGDALWRDGFGVIFPELEGRPGFDEQRAVLDLIESLAPATIIPGHGPVFTDVRDAIDRARRRLAHLGADPARNARHAIKVFLKFLLLDRESIPVDEVASLVASMALVRRANALYVGMPEDQLGPWAMRSLVEAGAARVEQGRLVNA